MCKASKHGQNRTTMASFVKFGNDRPHRVRIESFKVLSLVKDQNNMLPRL